jgi:2,6-dihydroxypseudooxynicotine hydrolase
VSRVSDARVQAAIDNWAPRLIANGVDYNDFVRVTSSISRWDEWLDAWTAAADVHRTLGVQARGAGRLQSAGEAFLRAAVTYHFAKFVWVLDPERNRWVTNAAVRTLYEAHAILDPSARRIEADLEGHLIAANLRWPRLTEPAPLVILLPGLDSTKEEFYLWESVFLGRGMATLSLDGPGQGESGFRTSIRADYEVAVGAILDAVSGLQGLDLGRVGAAGVSLGGYYVVRSAAFEPRLKAIAGVSGPYDMAAQWDSMPALTREAFSHHSGASDEEDARRRATELSLAGVAERVGQPSLVVTGKLDPVVPWEQTRRIADEIPHSEWVLYEEGTHVCNNIPFKYRPLVADWMRDQLG